MMLKIGSFISSLFNTSEVIIFAYQNNYRHQIMQAINLADKHPKLMFNCIINFEGDYKIKNQSEIIQKKTKNLNLIFHPSNRKIENHLLLLQLITKIKNVSNYIILNQHSRKLFNNIHSYKHIKYQLFDDIDAIKINNKKFIKYYLNGNKLENLRLLLS